jgi:ATP-binding cassette subfamily B multidrug efflux pump
MRANHTWNAPDVLKRFEYLIDPFPPDDADAPPQRLGAFLIHYSRAALPWLLAMAVLTAALSVVEIFFVTFLGNLVDWLAAADPSTFLADHAWELAGMAALIVIGFPLLSFLQSLLQFQTIFGHYPMAVRWRTHRTMLGQSMTFFQDEFAGRVSQKVMQTALAVRETVTKILDVGVYIVVYFIGTTFLLAKADLWFVAPLALWLAAYIGLLWYFVPRLGVVGARQADTRAQMTGRIVDSYTNIQTIKLFAHTTREQEYARDAMDEFLVTVRQQGRLFTHLTNALNIINSLLLAVAAGIAIYGWHRGLVSLGAVTVAIGLVTRLRAMSQWILWEVAGLFENIGTVEDGMAMLAKPVSIVDAPDAKELVVSKGEVRFEAARFHYGRASKVIEDFTFTIRPGEKIGLVGRSGAGKSTIVNLLLRFYDLEGGRMLIDGQDIAKVTQESLRRQIGVVTQDTSLLHRSVRDNIAYGRPQATDAQVSEAARLAHADEFIADLTDPHGRTGYAAHVGERGVKLSGGQRQRVAIARIFLKDAPILVLDEATSALDSEIEAAIQQTLYRLMEGKTVIAIAHRLSTIAAMDRLVVLDKGRIAEVGTHDELLQRNGLYAALWSRQSGGFLDFDAVGQAAE